MVNGYADSNGEKGCEWEKDSWEIHIDFERLVWMTAVRLKDACIRSVMNCLSSE